MVRFFRWALKAMGFHIHDWSEWEDFGEVQSTVTKGVVAVMQISKCRTCGKKKTNRVWVI